MTCTWVWKARWLAEIDTARMAVWLWTGSCKSGHTPSTADPTLPAPHLSPGALGTVRRKGEEQGFSHQEPQSKGKLEEAPLPRGVGVLDSAGEVRGRRQAELPGAGSPQRCLEGEQGHLPGRGCERVLAARTEWRGNPVSTTPVSPKGACWTGWCPAGSAGLPS